MTTTASEAIDITTRRAELGHLALHYCLAPSTRRVVC